MLPGANGPEATGWRPAVRSLTNSSRSMAWLTASLASMLSNGGFDSLNITYVTSAKSEVDNTLIVPASASASTRSRSSPVLVCIRS